MTLRVYVAGSSREIERAERMIAEVRAIPGVEITFDWAAAIRQAGAANEGLTDEQAIEASHACIEGVLNADVFVALLPPSGVPADGLMYELATAHRACGMAIQTILVGPYERSIFTRAHSRPEQCVRVAEDKDAISDIKRVLSWGLPSRQDMRAIQRERERRRKALIRQRRAASSA